MVARYISAALLLSSMDCLHPISGGSCVLKDPYCVVQPRSRYESSVDQKKSNLSSTHMSTFQYSRLYSAVVLLATLHTIVFAGSDQDRKVVRPLPEHHMIHVNCSAVRLVRIYLVI